jgi:hypothetical protein
MKIKFLLGSEEASCAKLSRRSVHCSELSTEVKIADWETADVSGSRWASFRGEISQSCSLSTTTHNPCLAL